MALGFKAKYEMIINKMPMLKLTFWISFLIITFQKTSFGQEKILLRDDFKNNRRGWELQNDSNFLVSITDGVLHLEKLHKNFTSRGCLWYSKNIHRLNTLNNLSLTFYARFVSGGDIMDMIDFQWGDKGKVVNGRLNSNLYQLQFFIRGEVRLNYFNSNWNYFVRKNIKTLLGSEFNSNQFNKYEIIQKDGFIIFYINNKEVLKQLTKPIEGSSIGFQQCLKSAWEIDKIEIRQQASNKTITPDTLNLITSPDKNQIINPSDKELKVYPNTFNKVLHVNIFLDEEEIALINLIDITGAVLQEHRRKLQKGFQHIMMYADVVPGSYLLRLQIGEKVLSTTVIKQ